MAQDRPDLCPKELHNASVDLQKEHVSRNMGGIPGFYEEDIAKSSDLDWLNPDNVRLTLTHTPNHNFFSLDKIKDLWQASRTCIDMCFYRINIIDRYVIGI
jgi:hypothetical protein